MREALHSIFKGGKHSVDSRIMKEVVAGILLCLMSMPFVTVEACNKANNGPLMLTPFIENGDLETGRHRARVKDPINGIGSLPFESYSGYITVNESSGSNMFFWFFPAMVRTVCSVFIYSYQGRGR